MKKTMLQTIISVVILAGLMIIQGCGSKDVTPDGSTVTISPSLAPISAVGYDFCEPALNVIVRYKDGTIQPSAKITVYGEWAIPNMPITTVAQSGLYQFHDGPNCTGALLNDGFTAYTDSKSGIYTFSISIPATYTFIDSSGTSTTVYNAFLDTITVTSGPAMGTETLSLNQTATP
jgi:hypothetical protein